MSLFPLHVAGKCGIVKDKQNNPQKRALKVLSTKSRLLKPSRPVIISLRPADILLNKNFI